MLAPPAPSSSPAPAAPGMMIAAAIASEEGLEYAKKHFSAQDTSIWCGTVDSELTVKSYIVPGLGDAGDLAYGDKM